MQNIDKSGERRKPQTINKLFALQTALMIKKMTKAQCLIFSIVVEYTNDVFDGAAWPSKETLAYVSGLHVKTVQKAIPQLKTLLGVDIKKGGGRRKPNRYRVPLSAFTDPPFRARMEEAAALMAEKREQDDSRLQDYQSTGPKSGLTTDFQETGADRLQTGANSLQKGSKNAPRYLLNNPTEKNPSAPAARPDGARSAGRSIHSIACQIEREWKSGTLSSIRAVEELTKLTEITDDLEEIGHLERIALEIEISDGLAGLSE